MYEHLPDFVQGGKEGVRVRHLLTHSAGFDQGPDVWYDSPGFGCPALRKSPPELAFSCMDRVYRDYTRSRLWARPGARYKYSDCSMFGVMYLVGAVARARGYVGRADLRADCRDVAVGWQQCYYEAFVRRHVFERLGLNHTGYLPARALWPAIAPVSRHRQGVVDDGNAFAMGGISGHAGVFTDVRDAARLTQRWLAPAPDFLSAATVATFTAQANPLLSSRALGWNTNAAAPDRGWGHSCGTLAPTTFMHVGFTGSLICADPTRRLGVVLLTNRVYPDRSSAHMREYRRNFTTAVQSIYDSLHAFPDQP